MLNNTLQDKLRNITAKNLGLLGAVDMAYIRPVTQDGEALYGLYSADGNLITLAASYSLAMLEADQRDIEAFSTH